MPTTQYGRIVFGDAASIKKFHRRTHPSEKTRRDWRPCGETNHPGKTWPEEPYGPCPSVSESGIKIYIASLDLNCREKDTLKDHGETWPSTRPITPCLPTRLDKNSSKHNVCIYILPSVPPEYQVPTTTITLHKPKHHQKVPPTTVSQDITSHPKPQTPTLTTSTSNPPVKTSTHAPPPPPPPTTQPQKKCPTTP